ncbi:hypothetical protein ACOME3_009206 [Neoechinorhynchus agilis]
MLLVLIVVLIVQTTNGLKCHGYIGTTRGDLDRVLDCGKNGSIPAHCYTIQSQSIQMLGCIEGISYNRDVKEDATMTAASLLRLMKTLHNQTPNSERHFRHRIRQMLNHPNMNGYHDNPSLLTVKQQMCHTDFCNGALASFMAISNLSIGVASLIAILCI